VSAQGALAPLGTNTKSAAAFEAETAVLQLPDAVSVARLERYELQSVARRVLTGHRITHCLRTMLPGAAAVPVYYAASSSSSHYGQLMVCGSVWFCPVCASKISERRRRELEQALSWWVAKGHTVLLVTYTFSHGRGDHVGEILDYFLGAQHVMTGNRPYKRLKASCGVIHSIKALEVTWGAENGWHPHSHWLLFCDGNVDVPRMENELYRIWKAEAAKKGLSMNRAHGVKIQNTFGAVADYVAKFGKQKTWGAEHELSKAHLKRGRGERYAPFELLRWLAETGEWLPAELFTQYAAYFAGRRQLVWSRGLRAAAGLVEEKTDEEIASEIEEEAIILALLTAEDWRLVKRFNQRGQLLEVARSGDSGAVLAFVEALHRRACASEVERSAAAEAARCAHPRCGVEV
jgi:hypothetical protein